MWTLDFLFLLNSVIQIHIWSKEDFFQIISQTVDWSSYWYSYMNSSKLQKNCNEFVWSKAYNLHFIMTRHSHGKGRGRTIFLKAASVCCLFSKGMIASNPLGYKWLQFARRVCVCGGGVSNTELAKMAEVLFPAISIRNGEWAYQSTAEACLFPWVFVEMYILAYGQKKSPPGCLQCKNGSISKRIYLKATITL